MQNVLNLLKLQIDNKTDILKTKSPKKMALAVLKALALIVVASLAVWYVEGRIFILNIDINSELVAIILLVTQLISLLFAVGHIINILYLSKDNEMLICYPVTANELFTSKILLIYLKEVMVNAFILIPIFFGLSKIGGMGVEFYLSFPIMLLVLPVLPIVLASFLSIIVMQIIKFLRNHAFLSIIIILSLVLAGLVGYLGLIGGIMDSFDIANEQLETVHKINTSIANIGSKILVYHQLAWAMFSFKGYMYIGLFVALCAVLFVITILLIRPFYLKTAMSSIEHSVKVKEKPRKFKNVSPFRSLVGKEIKSLFRSPSEIFEYFLFTLLMPFIVFTYDKFLMALSVEQAGVNMIAGTHVMVVAILAMLSNIVSASAVSKEGGNFYLSKVVPVDYYTQIFAKLVFNIIFTAGALFVTMIVSFFIYPAWQVIMGTIAILFASVGHAAMSVDMDLKNPTIQFEGNGKNSTTSKSTPKSVITALFGGFLLGFVIIMLSSMEMVLVPYLLIITLSFLFMLYRICLLILRINSRYNKIEM